VAHDLAEDVQFADAPGDELPELRAEVEDEDEFRIGTWAWCDVLRAAKDRS